jgi:CheY-like chemotaxis protein
LSAAPHILVVDDEPGVLRYMRTLLEVESFRVETASSGKEALTRIESRSLTSSSRLADAGMVWKHWRCFGNRPN